MDQAIEQRFRKGEQAALTWDPVHGGKRGWICFEDDKTVDLGDDPQKAHFERIADLMTSGRYYPPDAVQFIGRFSEEGRTMSAGDRILQRAPLLGKLGLIYAWSMVELYVVERTQDRCLVGYVTTERHHGRGIWNAELKWTEGRLSLRVRSTASPNSWLFRLGLPVARYLQLRARTRSIEEFRRIVDPPASDFR